MNIIKLSFYQKIFFLTSLCITMHASAMITQQSCKSSPAFSIAEYFKNEDLKEHNLRQAAQNNDMPSLTQLINKEVDVNAQDTNTGNTALHFAAANGHALIAGILIGSGAQVNIQNCAGNTPLHSATYTQENVECVRVLLTCGADQTIKNNIDFGYCPANYLDQDASPAEGKVTKRDTFFYKTHPMLLRDALEKLLKNRH
jgi:ankyrin repeat protein